MSNSFGQLFRITTFGESHGKSIGVIIDGCPAGIDFNLDFIVSELNRRRPGQSSITSQRKEDDYPEVLSGVYEGKTTGAPVCIVIANKDQKSADYAHIASQFRPSHADYTYFIKYGTRDFRGGGRSSARETANWVAAGAVAKMLLKRVGIHITAYVSSVGDIVLKKNYKVLNLSEAEQNIVRCPDPASADQMIELIKKIRKQGDTIGGVVSCVAENMIPGLGEPVFNKLHAALGHAMMSINAVKGFEYGSGFAGTKMKGSQHNDQIISEKGKVTTRTNFSGGIQGGISNGADIYFNVAFKPVATLMIDQESLNEAGEQVIIQGKGRHDPCVVPRAVPIVEAMAALVIADFVMISQSTKLGALSDHK